MALVKPRIKFIALKGERAFFFPTGVKVIFRDLDMLTKVFFLLVCL